jgi:sugar phosphate isomerase/epimerase
MEEKKEVCVLVSIPFPLLKEKYLDEVLKNEINVEVVLNAEALDTYSYKEFKEIAKILKEKGLKTTIHLPFMDLSPGALDPWIREISLKRIRIAMEISVLFEPLNMVLHTGYHSDYYREKKYEWRKVFIEKLAELKEFAEELNLILSLENTFEPDSEFFKEVLKNIEGVFWCFDPAHARVFSKENEITWLNTLYSWLKEIHCHDNNGEVDEHIGIGKGVIKFEEIFNFLKEKKLKPLLTSEAHNEKDTYWNLSYLKKFAKDLIQSK